MPESQVRVDSLYAHSADIGNVVDLTFDRMPVLEYNEEAGREREWQDRAKRLAYAELDKDPWRKRPDYCKRCLSPDRNHFNPGCSPSDMTIFHSLENYIDFKILRERLGSAQSAISQGQYPFTLSGMLGYDKKGTKSVWIVDSETGVIHDATNAEPAQALQVEPLSQIDSVNAEKRARVAALSPELAEARRRYIQQ